VTRKNTRKVHSARDKSRRSSVSMLTRTLTMYSTSKMIAVNSPSRNVPCSTLIRSLMDVVLTPSTRMSISVLVTTS
jgi:hypothetical protein